MSTPLNHVIMCTLSSSMLSKRGASLDSGLVVGREHVMPGSPLTLLKYTLPFWATRTMAESVEGWCDVRGGGCDWARDGCAAFVPAGMVPYRESVTVPPMPPGAKTPVDACCHSSCVAGGAADVEVEPREAVNSLGSREKR